MTQRGVFRVACWNIHHGAPGSTWFAKSESLIAGVAQLDADVVVLCEVDHRVWRSRFRNQTQMLAKRLGYHALFAPARRLTPGWYGNALLSRSLPRRTEVLALPAAARAENRSALLTAIPLGGAPSAWQAPIYRTPGAAVRAESRPLRNSLWSLQPWRPARTRR